MITPSATRWTEFAAAVRPRGDAFIDGSHVEARSGERLDAINPATEQVIATIASCDTADVDRAVASARRTFESGAWSRAAPAERKQVLLALAALVESNAEELALLESLETGKLVEEALTIDMADVVRTLRWYAEAIDKLYDEIAPTGTDDLALVTREPLGIVAAVVPWNFPLMLATWKIAPALAVGNSVVVKPAEQSTLTAVRFAELAIEAGLPAGALNVVTGRGELAGRALGLHMDVDCVCFTGSTEVGKLFLQYSGRSNMKQVWLECGGKSPNIVFSDVEDLPRAAAAAADGIFYNQGQVCSANSRLLIERSVKDEFLELLIAAASDYRPGDPLDPASKMGALVEAAHHEKVMTHIDAARREAELVLGGSAVTVAGRGYFVEPTIFDGVAPTARIAQSEVFGPVLAVTTFDGEEQAVEIANGTQFGLAASIWTDDLRRAHRLARSVRAGTVSVNKVDATETVVPFGGFKQSGIGRDLSLHSFDKYTGLKTTWIDLRG